MNTRGTRVLAAGVAVVLCGALAAAAAASDMVQKIPAIQGSPALIRNSELIGSVVLYPQGNTLGRIKDVLFDSQTGQATFLILDAESTATVHPMLVVPYQALQVSVNPADNHVTLVLGLRPDRLTAAPQITNNQWQMLQNPQFLEQARNFYQVKAYYAARPIENGGVPSLPPASPTSVMPQPCVNPANNTNDLPQDLVDFYNE